MAENEKKVFEIIKNKLGEFSFENATTIEKKISPFIKDHPAFSKLHFTKTESCPDGLSAEEVYKDRYNLLYFIDGLPSDPGQNTADQCPYRCGVALLPTGKKGRDYAGKGNY